MNGSRLIDLHHHFLPKEYVEALRKRGVDTIGGLPTPNWSREAALEFMDDRNIAAAVASLSDPGVFFGDEGEARELARMCNEAGADLLRSEPSRFAVLATLPLPDVEASLKELAYALDTLRLDGVCLLSNVGGYYLGDPAFEPLMAELDRRSCHVFVHPAAPPVRPELPYPNFLYEYTFDTTRAAVHLLYSGTLARYPQISFQLSHGGGVLPYLAWRVARGARVSTKFAEAVPEGPKAYIGDLYYDVALTANAAALASLLEVTDIEHLVFGSDWPFAAGLYTRPGDPAPGLQRFDPQDRVQIDRTNALTLFPRFAGEQAYA